VRIVELYCAVICEDGETFSAYFTTARGGTLSFQCSLKEIVERSCLIEDEGESEVLA
jgi:hypothetical protein